MAIKEYKLQEIGKFQNYETTFSKYHVSTDNMEGHKMPNFYPKSGNYFPKNSILMSNIRPYFNKVWYSDREGSKSPNVLCFIVKNKNAISKYIYYLICDSKFNNFWSKTSKGTTMPVGDKNALLNYKFKLPNLDEQQQIINIIEPFERLKNKINNIMEYLKMITLIQINNFNLPTDTSLKIFNNIQGYSFKSSDFKNKGQYKIFKISNILNNNEKNFSYTDNIVLKHLLKCGDVVTGLSGTIGTSCVIYENNMYILNQRLLAINSNIPLLIKMLIEKNKKILEQS